MKIKKSVIQVLILSILLLSMEIVPTCYAQSQDKSLDRQALLSAMKIIPEDRGLSETVTRAEFSSYVFKLLGISDISVRHYDYTDVPKTHWAYQYVMNMRDRDYMVGITDSMFYPDEAITSRQAIKVIVDVLGYSYAANQEGGYPNGYLKVAADIGLSNGINQSADSDLTLNDAVKLIYKSLSIKLMKTNYTGYYISDDETILNTYLDIYKIDGIVNANEWEALDGMVMEHGKVLIGAKIFSTGSTLIENDLGVQINAYVKEEENGENVILYYYTDDDIIEISSNDIISASTSALRYEENGSIKTQNIPSNVSLIYNGKLKFSFGAEHLEPKTGTVTLIKRNGRLECIRVMKYEVNILDSYNKNDEILYFKENGKSLDLKSDNIVCRIMKNDRYTEEKRFSEDDVICIAKSEDGSFADIIVTNETMAGTITRVDEEKVYIDNSAYKISDDFILNRSILKKSSEGVFYFDFLGNVVYMKYDGDNRDYCFFIKKTLNDEENVRIKYIDSKGEVNVAQLAEKAKCNSSRISASADELDSLKDSVIRLRFNDIGEINQILTPKNNTAESSIKYDSSDFSLDMNKSSIRYLANANGFATDGVRVWSVPKTMPVLCIELEKDGKLNYDESELLTAGDILVSGKEYQDLSFYDVDKETYIPRFALRITNSAAKMETDGNDTCVIVKIIDTIDIDDLPAKAVVYYQNGEIKSSLIKDSTTMGIEKYIPTEYANTKITDLKKGDACLFTKNINGDILSFMPSFIRGTITENKILTTDTSGYSQIRGYESVYGKIVRANDLQVTILLGNTEYNYLLSETNTYLYNEESNEISPIAMRDVRGYLGKQCYLRSNRKMAETVIIYE